MLQTVKKEHFQGTQECMSIAVVAVVAIIAVIAAIGLSPDHIRTVLTVTAHC